jgi:hypothetical protein
MTIHYPKLFYERVKQTVRRASTEIWDAVCFYSWLAKKNLQSFKRTHLSHVLATVLAVLVVFREWPEVSRMLGKQELPNPLGWLIVLLIVLTWFAFRWELSGDKLTTSPQELRFHYGAKLLLRHLEDLVLEGEFVTSPEMRFDKFVKLLLEIASDTFSVKYQVDAGLMVKQSGEDSLVLVKWSSGARYPEDLKIPLPFEKDSSKSGPAGLAYDNVQLVYVPKKKSRRAWPFTGIIDPEATGGGEPEYEPDAPQFCWVSASSPTLEDFRSVLCVPIVTCAGSRNERKFGVLNFSTKARDPFVDRDFFMAEFYSAILAQAFASMENRVVGTTEGS